jgi:chromate transporter
VTSASTEQLSSQLKEVAVVFLTFGFTAFGGPAAHIAMMRRELVTRRKWVSEERFLDLFGLANIIPGPSSTELAIFLGYERAGALGLAVAGAMFILPAVMIVLFLAWLYSRLGGLPAFGWAFYGIKPIIIAIILQALVGLTRTAIKTPLLAVTGVVAFALYLLTGNPILVLFGIGLAVMLITNGGRWIRKWSSDRDQRTLQSMLMVGLWRARFFLTAGLSRRALILVTAATATAGLFPLFLTFLKIGAVTYGSGYTLLAFMHTDLVVNTHWLTDKQLIDAVAVGQFTPGPVFTTATFIGYLTAGIPGAIVATVGIFLPSFVLVALVYPLGGRIRQSPLLSAFLDGVNVAALALIAGVLILLAHAALVDIFTVALAALAFLVLLRFKVNSAWLIVAGALVGLAVHLLHLPLLAI